MGIEEQVEFVTWWGGAEGRGREPQKNTPLPGPFSGAGRGIWLVPAFFGAPQDP